MNVKYKKRHVNVCRYIHWKLCEKHGLQEAQKWSEQEPDGRTNGTRFCEILQSSVIPRLKHDDQILLLLIKPRRKLRL